VSLHAAAWNGRDLPDGTIHSFTCTSDKRFFSALLRKASCCFIQVQVFFFEVERSHIYINEAEIFPCPTKSAVLVVMSERDYIRECRKIAALLEKNMQKRPVALRSASIRCMVRLPTAKQSTSRPIPHKRNPASIKKRSTNSAEQTQKQDDHHAHTCIGSDTNRQFLSLLLTINSPAFCDCFLCGGVLVCGIALCPNYTHTSLSCSCVCVCTQTQPKTSLAQNPAV
jgi:hypothetical protein